ncbi:MAG: orotate phosphoribosyltransferase-like protein [Methanomassiliicoccales archaeon]|jgi:orotate phosphoribosyltransferase|nr:orotate phosphoribosyltransferase-like protein [Methanomassiliicoccales archaeon]MDD1755653.1 orotate phosphoribosyltransferase-like protein [Methanomassiliicoccales archaeon]
MVDVKDLAKKAREYKERGLNEREIGDELHVSVDTVRYLLEEGMDGTLPPSDIKIGWRSIGVYGARIAMMSEILSDLIVEEMEQRDLDVEVVLGIAVNGVSFATYISDMLDSELAIYKPPVERGKAGGSISGNYASVEGKKVVIVDDVMSTGATAQEAIKDVRAAGGTPVLMVVIVNKSSQNEVDGVPLRGIIRARSMGGTILGHGPLRSFPYK